MLRKSQPVKSRQCYFAGRFTSGADDEGGVDLADLIVKIINERRGPVV